MKTSLEQGWWTIEEGEGPLIAVSLHSGHAVCEKMAPVLALSPAERLREEDPFTDGWTSISATRIFVHHSRFGFDLNRPREKAVYLLPEDAWGLRVWKDVPDEEIVAAALHQYDRFYAEVGSLLRRKIAAHGQFVIFDLHSYNHMRDGPSDPPASPDLNPDINLGTGTLDRTRWGAVADAFLRRARQIPVGGRFLDVRENIRFFGGAFPKWVNATFPDNGCALAIEVKKIFMDEWTGNPNLPAIEEIRGLLQEAAADVTDELTKQGDRA